ncbi:MAG: hypothetical protein V4489_06665, partial [Chlamydiota bacterium]
LATIDAMAPGLHKKLALVRFQFSRVSNRPLYEKIALASIDAMGTKSSIYTKESALETFQFDLLQDRAFYEKLESKLDALQDM